MVEMGGFTISRYGKSSNEINEKSSGIARDNSEAAFNIPVVIWLLKEKIAENLIPLLMIE